MCDRIRHVATQEKIDLPDNTLQALAHFSGGDLRKGLNYLQTGTVGKREEGSILRLEPKEVYKTAVGEVNPTPKSPHSGGR